MQKETGDTGFGVSRSFSRRAFIATLALSGLAPRVWADGVARGQGGLYRRLARIGLQRRAAWSVLPPPSGNEASVRFCDTYRRLTVHHDGTEPFTALRRQEVVRELRRIQGAHCKNGYTDIGYHFAVDRSGGLWEARPLHYQGAHVRFENEHNIGVLLLGNFERQRPAVAQWRALEGLCAVLCGHYRIATERVYGHRDLGQTHCPGRYAYPYMPALRHALGARGGQGKRI